MSGRSARTIRNFSLEVSPDLVLLDIREFTFQHLTVNWEVTSSQNGLNPPFPIPSSRTQASIFYIYISHYPSQKQNNENQDLGFPNKIHDISLNDKKQIYFRKIYQGLGFLLNSGNFLKMSRTRKYFLTNTIIYVFLHFP